jgi:hypothetical protein
MDRRVAAVIARLTSDVAIIAMTAFCRPCLDEKNQALADVSDYCCMRET